MINVRFDSFSVAFEKAPVRGAVAQIKAHSGRKDRIYRRSAFSNHFLSSTQFLFHKTISFRQTSHSRSAASRFSLSLLGENARNARAHAGACFQRRSDNTRSSFSFNRRRPPPPTQRSAIHWLVNSILHLDSCRHEEMNVLYNTVYTICETLTWLFEKLC